MMTNSNLGTSLNLIRLKSVLDRTGLSRSYVYALMKEDMFPKSVPLVPGGVARAWVEAEILEWIDQRIQDRDQVSTEVVH